MQERSGAGGHPVPSPRTRARSSRGFTLVEILTALAVLMVALSGIIGLLYGSFQHGRAAADRSAAAILIPDALRNIALSRYQDDGTYLTTSAVEQTDVYSAAGGYYRFKYRLTNEPDADPDYKGLYALTVVCYRDSERNATKLVQLSDPVTIYLRERE